METTNAPAIIGQESLSVLQTASEVLSRNQISVSKAGEIGQQIVALINTNGMNDRLDEKCNQYMVKVNETIKAMNERRSPITQLFTQVARQFTSLENELKEGQNVKFIQQQRNDFAAKKASEKRKSEEEAKRKLAIDNEKVEVKKKIEIDIITFVSKQINLTSDELLKKFNEATLVTIDNAIKEIKAFPIDYDNVHNLDGFSPANLTTIYLSKDDVKELIEQVKSEYLPDTRKTYWEAIDDLQVNLEGKVVARKSELERIAILEKQDAEAAEKAKADAADRQRLEAEKAKADAAEKAKQQEIAVQATAEAERMNNLFTATEASIVPDQGKAQIRTSLKITVSHQSAWVEIFSHFMQIEGMKLGIDELGKKSLNQMKAACEKHSTKTGELITSKYIKYEEDFTAVNKA